MSPATCRDIRLYGSPPLSLHLPPCPPSHHVLIVLSLLLSRDLHSLPIRPPIRPRWSHDHGSPSYMKLIFGFEFVLDSIRLDKSNTSKISQYFTIFEENIRRASRMYIYTLKYIYTTGSIIMTIFKSISVNALITTITRMQLSYYLACVIHIVLIIKSYVHSHSLAIG